MNRLDEGVIMGRGRIRLEEDGGREYWEKQFRSAASCNMLVTYSNSQESMRRTQAKTLSNKRYRT